MKVYGLWHGGNSYAVSGYRDIEVFDNITKAKEALLVRYQSNGAFRVSLRYINRPPELVYVPAVDQDSEMLLWLSRPYDLTNPHDEGPHDLPYPDRRLYFGPKHGVRMETC